MVNTELMSDKVKSIGALVENTFEAEGALFFLDRYLTERLIGQSDEVITWERIDCNDNEGSRRGYDIGLTSNRRLAQIDVFISNAEGIQEYSNSPEDFVAEIDNLQTEYDTFETRYYFNTVRLKTNPEVHNDETVFFQFTFEGGDTYLKALNLIETIKADKKTENFPTERAELKILAERVVKITKLLNKWYWDKGKAEFSWLDEIDVPNEDGGIQSMEVEDLTDNLESDLARVIRLNSVFLLAGENDLQIKPVADAQALLKKFEPFNNDIVKAVS